MLAPITAPFLIKSSNTDTEDSLSIFKMVSTETVKFFFINKSNNLYNLDFKVRKQQ